MTKPLKISIVGGSLAGCIAGNLMSQAGHDVKVFERSKRGLVGRGGGLSTSSTVIREMRELGLLDADFPVSPFDILDMAKTTDPSAYMGISDSLDVPMDLECVHWGGLWQNLHKQLPDGVYFRDKTVTEVHDLGEQVTIKFQDGTSETSDLVLFADGYNSVGRKMMFPEQELEYRGYYVWRGILPETEVDDLKPLDNHPRYSFKSIPGSFIAYLIPNDKGENAVGKRIINWASYIPLEADKLDEFMIDNQGNRRAGAIPVGFMRPEQDAEVLALMKQQLPRYYTEIMERSVGNQIQLINTVTPKAFAKGRMALIGDAGALAQPMTGAGVFKSFENARDLAKTLATVDNLEDALSQWSKRQTDVANRLLELGAEMEEAFIWNTIDFSKASNAEGRKWWDDSINLPYEFSYFAEEARNLSAVKA